MFLTCGGSVMSARARSKLFKLACGLYSWLLVVAPVSAGTYSFDFLSSDNVYQLTGTFTTSGATDGITNGASLGSDIVSISGSIIGPYGGSITSLVTNPVQPAMFTNYGIGFMYDNVAFPNSPYLDIGGVLFTTGTGTIWNLWANSAQGPNNYELFSWTAAGGSVGNWGDAVSAIGNLTVVSPIPEPTIFAQMLAGLGLLGFIVLRRIGSPTSV